MAVLLNNAGTGAKGTALAGLDNWKKVIDVNLWGCVFTVLPLSFWKPNILPTEPLASGSNRIGFVSAIYVQQTFGPLMVLQENPSVIINTGSKQGITNPPYVMLPVP